MAYTIAQTTTTCVQLRAILILLAFQHTTYLKRKRNHGLKSKLLLPSPDMDTYRNRLIT